MSEEQKNKYAFELMVKNNPDEAVKQLIMLNKFNQQNFKKRHLLQQRVDKAIELLEKYGLVDENGNFDTYLDTIDLKELYEILKGSE